VSGKTAEGVSIRSDFIAAARAALDARKPVQRPTAPARDLDSLDDFEPNLDPYQSLGAWQ
jgi:hypothetical protein